MSILNKGKALIFTSGIKAYNKETLNDEIRKLITANVQLITNKIKIEKAKVNLKVDKMRLFNEKNSLVAKREKF